MKRILYILLILSLGLMTFPRDAFAQARDIDFDWIAQTVDKLLASYCPGISIRLMGADNDGNGIWEEDTLAMLAAVLRGGTRVGPTCISAANVAQIQADFATNRALVEADMMIYGEYGIPFIAPNVARTYVLGAYGSDKLSNMLRAELGPVGGDLTANLLIDYFAGLVTTGEAATFTHINNYIGQILDGLCAGMGNQAITGIGNMWHLLRLEKTTRSLYLDSTKYTATRWGTGGSRANLFGAAGNFDSTGTVTDTINNLTEYNTAKTNNPVVWREAFLTGNGIVNPAMHITAPPVGTPAVNHLLNGDMTNGAGGAPTQWTLGANWTSNPQDDVAAVDAPTGLFLVMKHTAGSAAELTQTQAQQPATDKIVTGVNYRVEFSYRWYTTGHSTTEGITIGLGSATSGLFTITDPNDIGWHSEVVYLAAGGANPSFRVIPTASFVGYIDNVWVKIAALAGDLLDTGTVGFAGGVTPFTQIWEDAQHFPSSQSYNRLNNDSFKGNANNWDVVNWSYVDKGGPFTAIPYQRMEKTGAGVATLGQTSANMEEPLVVGEWYTVAYFIYQTAGTITPNLSGTNLTARAFRHSGELGQMVSELVQNGAGTQQLQFVTDDAFRGRIYWVYWGRYNNFALDPYYTGSPAGSRTPAFVADGVLGDPNDNGYRGVVPATKDLVYTYLLPAHNGMLPWLRLSDSPAYSSATIYNPPDRAGTVPAGSIGEEVLGGRTTPMMAIQVGPRTFAISPQPTTPLFAYTGQLFSMTSGAVGGDSVPQYQWYKGNPGDTSTPVGVAFSKTYSVASAVPANAGTYFMRATNLAGFLDSAPVVVTVVNPVTISGTLVGGNKAVGGSHTFSVTATGGAGPITYALYKVGNGAPLQTNGTGTFTLSPLVATDEGSYYVTATDAPTGTSLATSNTAALTVLTCVNPSPQTVTSGADNVTFTATGLQGTGGYTYQWYLDGVLVADASGHISGATTATLRLDNVQVTDGTYTGHAGVYTCVVRDSSSAQVTSAGAVLTVNAATVTVSGPGNQSVYYTQTATFTVTPSGGSGTGFAYTYVWYLQGNPTPLANGAKYDLTTPGTLRVLNAATTDNGAVFYCTVGETPGVRPPAALVTSGNGTLTVNPYAVAASVAPAGPLAPYVSQNVLLTCTASSTPAGGLTYEWQKGGVAIAPPQTASTLSLNNIQLSDSGSYTCVVKSVVNPSFVPGTVSNAVVITVGHVPINITSQPPANTSKYESETATFTITATVSAGTITYQWQRWNGAAWVNVGTSAASYTTAALTVAADNGSKYRCLVGTTAEPGYTVASTEANLSVSLAAINIGTQPSGAQKYVGDSQTFMISASGGVGALTYQWQKWNGASWVNAGVGASYTINPLAVSDAADYRCLVGDNARPPQPQVASNTVTLQVQPRITVSALPNPVNKKAGDTYSFSVTASGGYGTLSYQWKKNGVNVGTNSATLNLGTLSYSNQDSYTCTVTDTLTDTKTTNVANLTVLEIQTQPSGGNKTVGTSHTFAVVVTPGSGVPGYTYVWKKGGTPIGQTTSSFTISSLVVGDSGTYTCDVQDSAGVVLTSAQAVLVVTANPIVIDTQPQADTKYVTQSTTFTIAAHGGTGTLTYQWQKWDGTSWANVATGTSYTISPLATTDAGRFRCQITDTVAQVATSNEAVLTVNLVPITITGDITDVTKYVTESYTFTVTANSPIGTLHYQWQKGGTNTGSDSPSLPLTNLALADAGSYQCLITNSANPGGTPSTNSTLAQLTVNLVPINITLQPVGGSQYVSESHTFSVAANSPLGTLSYRWQKDRVDTSGTNTTYAIGYLNTTDTGAYRCVLVNSANPSGQGVVYSDEVTLTVTLAAINVSAPVGGQKVAGGTHTFSVTASGGVGTLTYQWQKDGLDVLDAAGHIAGATTNTLVLSNLATGDGGTYVCLVGDNAHPSAAPLVASAGALLEVRSAVSISVHPGGANKKVGDNYTFTVTATGEYTPYTYQWYRDATPVGSNSDTLTLTGLVASDQGSYTCQVTGALGSTATSNPAVFTVLAIETQPSPQSTTARGSATFTVVVKDASGVPGYTYQWKYKGADIAGETTSLLILSNCQGGAPDGNPAPVNPDGDEGNYSCVVTDAASVSLESSAEPLTVNSNALNIAPPTSGRAHVGETFGFEVTVSGGYGPAYTYRWQKGGVDLADSAGHIAGATSNTLQLTNLVADDAGSYVCLVGEVGVRTGDPLPLAASASADLQIADAVSITSQPAGALLYVGDSFTTTVAGAGGFGMLTYQWMRNGGSMSDETNASLTPFAVALLNNGDQYACAVSDEAGSSATSDPAVLTVVPHVSITTNPAGGTMELGTPYSMTVAATGGKGALHYTWYRNSGQVGTDSATYLIPSPSLGDVGNYWCVVSDSGTPTADSATSTVATLTIHATFGFASEPQSTRKYVGDSYTLDCTVQFETGSLTYTWFNPAGAVIPQGLNDPPNARLLKPLRLDMSGAYYVIVVDDMGTPDNPDDDVSITSSPANVQVKEHLAIATQPMAGTGLTDSSYTFTVATGNTGFGPLTYEWRKEGSSVVIGTGVSLKLEPLHLTDAGLYYVTVHDDLTDAVVSDRAELKVVDASVPAATAAGLCAALAGLVIAGVRALRRKR